MWRGWLRDRFFGGFDAAFSTREQLAEAARRAQQGGEAMAGGADYTPNLMRFLSNPTCGSGCYCRVADCGDHLVAPATGIAVRLIHPRWPVGCRIQQQGDIHEHAHGGYPIALAKLI